MRREDLPIAEPCHEDWNAMEPRDKARFCASCQLDVLDVSAMREREAKAFASKPRATRVCVSYILRSDGTIRFSDSKPLGAPDVPTGSLVRRGRTMVAAAALALAACQPVKDAAGALGASVAHARPEVTEVRLAGEPMPTPPPVVDAGVPTTPRTPVPTSTTPVESTVPTSLPSKPDVETPIRRQHVSRPPEMRINGGLAPSHMPCDPSTGL